MWDATGWRIYLGLPHGEGHPWLNAAAKRRFGKLSKRLAKSHVEDAVYGGSRTSADNVADRFAGSCMKRFILDKPFVGWRGNIRYARAIVSTLLGRKDTEIIDTYHERARAEHHYKHEKDWD